MVLSTCRIVFEDMFFSMFCLSIEYIHVPWERRNQRLLLGSSNKSFYSVLNMMKMIIREAPSNKVKIANRS